jgi:hypothetical protein
MVSTPCRSGRESFPTSPSSTSPFTHCAPQSPNNFKLRVSDISPYRSYTSLSPRTRLFFGLGIMANAALALQFSDQIENALGLVPTKDDEKELREKMPRVTTVDKS